MKVYLLAIYLIAMQIMSATNIAAATVTTTHTASIDIHVTDDDGNKIIMQKPAQRIVSLAPHITELLFAAGGGARIVGAVRYSDYPTAAKRIPQIGDANQIDLERIITLKPDLLVVWQHGNPERQLEQLRKLGIPLFYSAPRKLNDIPDSIVRLGQLMNTNQEAQKSATQLKQSLIQLTKTYKNTHQNNVPIRVFYQIWHQPLYTLSEQHIVNDAIRLCGGENVFAKQKTIAPSVSIESVLLANPEAIFVNGDNDQVKERIKFWQRYPALSAVQYANLLNVEGDLLSRPSPRMIAGTAQLCEKLEQARQRRDRVMRINNIQKNN